MSQIASRILDPRNGGDVMWSLSVRNVLNCDCACAESTTQSRYPAISKTGKRMIAHCAQISFISPTGAWDLYRKAQDVLELEFGVGQLYWKVSGPLIKRADRRKGDLRDWLDQTLETLDTGHWTHKKEEAHTQQNKRGTTHNTRGGLSLAKKIFETSASEFRCTVPLVLVAGGGSNRRWDRSSSILIIIM